MGKGCVLMRAYLELAKRAFKNNLAYRTDAIIGIANTLVTIVVNIAIWKAIYDERVVVEGIQFKLVVTNIIIGVAILNIFSMDEFTVARKVRDGSIAMELLKPMNFKMYVFMNNIGNLLYKVIMQFFPSVILAILLIGILPPYSLIMFVLFLVSIILGYMVLYNMSFIISIISFWYFNIWSFVIFKEVIITVCSGVFLPLWFMPTWMTHIISMTPFDSIFFIPISIYLGQLSANQILACILKQLVWAVVLYAIGKSLWSIGIKKLVIQGG